MYKRKYSKVFISSKIADEQQQELNREIYKVCYKLNFDTYLPQIAVPIDTTMTPLQILEVNERAVNESDLLLMVFDKAGAGGGMEYQRALILQKPIIGYRSITSLRTEQLGVMIEGAWERIPKEYKASTIKRLENILTKMSLEGEK